MFEEDLYQAVSSDPVVSALIGDRIYPEVLPGGVQLPAATYQLIASPRSMVQTGPSYTRPVYRWNAFAKTNDQALAVAYAIMKVAPAAFNGWIGDESASHEPQTGLFRRMFEMRAIIDPPEVTA
jgi:hypothetical protein